MPKTVMNATLDTTSAIEFTNIVLTTTLPLHPFFVAYPHLSVALVEDDDIYAETPVVAGGVDTGTWEMNSGLCINPVKQSITLAVIAKKDDHSIRFGSTKLSVIELLKQIVARPDGYQEFKIEDSKSSVQLLVTCTIKASPSLIPSRPPSRAGTLGNQATHTQSDHKQDSSELHSREDLESLYATVTRMPDHDEKKAHELSMLGRAYYAAYDKGGVREDLETAISLHEAALQHTGTSHPQLPEHIHHLSMSLTIRFRETGDVVDIERAISKLQTALKITGDSDAEKPDRLSTLGSAFQLRFERLGDLEDLQNAILLKKQVVDMTVDGDPEKPRRLCNLGIALGSRFERLGSLEDMEDAGLSLRKAVQLLPDGHPDKPPLFSILGVFLQSCFKRVGNIEDLEDGISNQRKAVELTPDGHRDKPKLLHNLGIGLQLRFRRLGSLVDLEDAISNQRKVVELTPDGHPDKPSRLNNLGSALRSRFELQGSLEDLEDAISNRRTAVELTPDDHSDKPALINNLGNELESRFRRLGDLVDLEDALSHRRRAVELTPDNHPEKPDWFNNLGSALQFRFERLGGLRDLEDAISNKRKAVELTPDGHPDKPGWLNNLGTALMARSRRLGSLQDLEDAILNKRRAVELTPDDHPDKPEQLSSLGNALESRFQRLGDLADLEDAISNHRKAVELTPDGHHKTASLLNNLGSSLQARFSRLKSLSDLEEAISYLQQVVDLIPDGHPDKSGYLFNLGGAFFSRFIHLKILSDLESTIFAFSTAANSPTGSAMMRFKAAHVWAHLCEGAYRSPLEAFSCAIDLLPRIAWLGLAVTDQHALLAKVGDIVRDAVAAAIKYKDYETAVVWAEQGRSIVWQNLLGLRSPIDKLRESHPETADRLYNISRQLEGSGSRDVNLVGIPAAPVEDTSAKYSKLAIEWDNLIDEIRRFPDFEGFLRAKIFRQLAPAAHEGPVVILNVNDSQCNALVLVSDESTERSVSVVSILLERFSHEKSKTLFQTLKELLSSAGVRERNDRKTGRTQSLKGSNTKFKVILGILWRDVVKPVIECLSLKAEPNRPPRIWWCATGLLAFLPIHAAGLYDTEEIGEKLSDYVVSSYTPTLTAILELSDPVVREDFQVLTVAQASAPGAEIIPKTEDEVKIVQNITASVRTLNLEREDATVQRVRQGMMESNWIHLACHGQQNSVDPMESGFLLHDETLKLSEIVKMSLPKADFAFLSACQTAMGDEKVAEESAHLAAGMLLSGCRGVIATTWSIRDEDGPSMAEAVYRQMFRDGKPNRKEAAYALHEAVKVLRGSGVECVSWVPFIHIGR